jgi:hypothetical protein
MSTLFSKESIKLIINNFFYKTEIKYNYKHYHESFYDKLAYILNLLIDENYIEYCEMFSYNKEYIDINKLLDNYYCLNNYIELIYLLYEIIIKINMLDYSYHYIDDIILLKELEYHKNLNFILILIQKKEPINVNAIINSLSNMKF